MEDEIHTNNNVEDFERENTKVGLVVFEATSKNQCRLLVDIKEENSIQQPKY
jgi:hypothetical protein